MFKNYPVARDVPAVFTEVCTYTRQSTGSTQIMADVPSCLSPLRDMPRRTQDFRILAPGPVRLRGFRAYTTQSEEFLLDESLDPTWDPVKYASWFSASGTYEDYEARVFPDRLEMPDLSVNQTITEPVLSLCSAEPSNYGSWIYRILPKLVADQEKDRALFLYAHTPWQKNLLDFFAPGRPVVYHYPRQSYDLKDVRVATMRNWGVFFDDQTRAFYRSHAEAIPGKSDLRMIYLSRAGQKIRPMLNEALLEDGLRARGFAIVKPETLSLSDRIRMIRDAEVIACPGGSGLFNLVFANSAKLVLDIEASKRWISAHTRLMNSLELPHLVLIGDQAQAGDPHAEWTAPVHDAMHCLDQML